VDAAESYVNDQLKIDLIENEETYTVRFLGKSFLRDPNQFVLPILSKALEDTIAGAKRMVIDFRDLAYMNSSTLTPVMKILERARVGTGEITVAYKKSLKWQDISFSALIIFQTPDHRIEIAGMD